MFLSRYILIINLHINTSENNQFDKICLTDKQTILWLSKINRFLFFFLMVTLYFLNLRQIKECIDFLWCDFFSLLSMETKFGIHTIFHRWNYKFENFGKTENHIQLVSLTCGQLRVIFVIRQFYLTIKCSDWKMDR